MSTYGCSQGIALLGSSLKQARHVLFLSIQLWGVPVHTSQILVIWRWMSANVGTGEAAEWWNRAVVCGCWGLTSMLRVIWWCAESRDLLTLGEGMKSL